MSSTTLETLKPIVDKTIGSLGREKFRIDPVAGPRLSMATSIVSAAYKRHGRILEVAIRTRLAESPYFTVWTEPAFHVSETADRAIRGRNADIAESLPIELPYGSPGRTLQVDAFVFDSRVKTVRAYEIKRGNGAYDSGKKRSILRDLLCLQALLRSYAVSRSLEPSIAEARLISYYGIRALTADLNLVGEDLDDHFVFPVKKYVDEVNTYFQEQLHALLRDSLALSSSEKSRLCDACPIHERADLLS